VVLAVVVTLGLGTHGFSTARPERRTADCVLLSAQLFALHTNVPENPDEHIPWTLEVARFAAPALAVGGLVFASAAAGWLVRRLVRKSASPTRDSRPGVLDVLGAEPPRRPTDPWTILSVPVVAAAPRLMRPTTQNQLW
jgi:hypothetical protein